MGTALLERLVQIARAEKVRHVVGDLLAENQSMRHLCQKLGFRMSYNTGDPVIRAIIDI